MSSPKINVKRLDPAVNSSLWRSNESGRYAWRSGLRGPRTYGLAAGRKVSQTKDLPANEITLLCLSPKDVEPVTQIIDENGKRFRSTGYPRRKRWPKPATRWIFTGRIRVRKPIRYFCSLHCIWMRKGLGSRNRLTPGYRKTIRSIVPPPDHSGGGNERRDVCRGPRACLLMDHVIGIRRRSDDYSYR